MIATSPRLSLCAAILLGAGLVLACAVPTAAADNAPCTHEDALEMGAKLHHELDVTSPRQRAAKTEAEKKALMDAFFRLTDASDALLRGDDATACAAYREIAAEQGIDLE